jgi:phosphoribosylglycinamide formyltransferase-1
VDEGCDTGPIILQKAVMVEDGDTPEMLQRRVMEQAEWELLPEAVRLIAENKIVIENNVVKIKN